MQFDVELLNKNIFSVVKESESAYEKLTGHQTNSEVFDPKYFAYHPLNIGVLKNWKENIRNELVDFSYKPLAL